MLETPLVRNLGTWSAGGVYVAGVAQRTMTIPGARPHRAAPGQRAGWADRLGPPWHSGLPHAVGRMVPWIKAMGQIQPAAPS
jgi:hypothetical protein